MSTGRADRALQAIFSFFLGLMLTAFFGVGVYTFSPPPDGDLRPQMEAIPLEARQLRGGRDNSQLTADEIRAIEDLEDQRAALEAELREASGTWARQTSIALVILATLIMAVSLAPAPSVLSNGLLLGGVFTMLYGVGWIIGSEANMAHFFVMTAALVVTVGLGYLRFVRRSREAAGGAGEPGSVDGEIERRLRAVEDRLDRVADALGR